MYVSEGWRGRNVSFSENFRYVINERSLRQSVICKQQLIRANVSQISTKDGLIKVGYKATDVVCITCDALNDLVPFEQFLQSEKHK